MTHRFKFYRSPSNTVEGGRVFESAMTTRIGLNLVLNDEIEDFELFSNAPEKGKFDDIVVTIVDQNKVQQKYGIQLKFKLNKPLTANGLGHLVNQHYDDYINLKDKVDFIPIIICKTKASFNLQKFSFRKQSVTVTVKIEEYSTKICELIVPLENMKCYKFTPNDEEIDKTLREFLNNFRFITTTSDASDIEESVKKDVSTNFSIGAEHSKFFADFIREWYYKPEKIVLFKTFMLEVISFYVLHILVPNQSSKERFSDKEEIFFKCIKKFKMTVFEQKKKAEVLQCAKKFVISIKLADQKNLVNIYQLKSFTEYKQKAVVSWLLGELPLIAIHKKNKIIEKLYSSKRFIFLTRKNVQLYENAFFNLKSLQEAEYELYNIVLESFSCQLQGKSCKLKLLIDMNEDKFQKLISTDELILMLNGSFSVGPIEELPLIHMPRTLTKHIVNKSVVKLGTNDTKLLITNTENFDCFKDFANANVVTGDTYFGTEKYTEIVSLGEEIHHFEALEQQEFEWIKSSRNIDKVKSCTIVSHNLVAEENVILYEEKTNLHLVCEMAGMGKSTLMKSIANKTSAKYWNIFVEVRNHAKQFRQQINKNDWKTYIYEVQKENLSPYDFEIFYIFFEANQVRWIWDGLDELFEDYYNVLCVLINDLCKDGSQHWLTSRDHLKNDLERRFNIISRSIMPLDEEQQKQFVQKRLALSDKEIPVIFELIINNIALYSMKKILEVPLHLYILTELLDKDKRKYDKKLREGEFTVADIYESFVDEKFLFYFTKESIKEGVDSPRNLDFKKKRLQIYRNLSLHLYFNSKEIEVLNIIIEEKNGKVKVDEIGLIQSTIDDFTPQFIHNSFGEYFVASLLVENWQKIKNISAFFFHEKFSNIRFFFDLLISRSHKAHRAVLHRNWELLEKCSDKELEEIDCRGRSALHLMSSWGKRFVIEKNIYFKDILSMPFNIMGFSKMKEAENYIRSFLKLAQKCKPSQLENIFLLDSLSLAVLSKSHLCCGILIGGSNDLHCKLKSDTIYNSIILCCLLHDYAKFFSKTFRIPENFGLEYIAVYFLAVNCIETIIENKIENFDVRKELRNGDSLLHLCYKVSPENVFNFDNNHCKKVTELLLKLGIDINVVNFFGETPLFNACKVWSEELVILLLDNGADINMVNINNETPLFNACKEGTENIVRILLDKGADINMINNCNETPIFNACERRNQNIVKLLLDKGADINMVNGNNKSPLFNACKDWSEELVILLLDKGADVNMINVDNETPLFPACKYSNANIVKLLLDKGADINMINVNNETPLFKACEYDNIDVVILLLDKCADTNIIKDKLDTLFVNTPIKEL